jgi:hypothetical protein
MTRASSFDERSRDPRARARSFVSLERRRSPLAIHDAWVQAEGLCRAREAERLHETFPVTRLALTGKASSRRACCDSRSLDHSQQESCRPGFAYPVTYRVGRCRTIVAARIATATSTAQGLVSINPGALCPNSWLERKDSPGPGAVGPFVASTASARVSSNCDPRNLG